MPPFPFFSNHPSNLTGFSSDCIFGRLIDAAGAALDAELFLPNNPPLVEVLLSSAYRPDDAFFP